MYLYSHNNNKRNEKPKIFLTIVITVFITVVVIENILILMNHERESYSAQRLSSQGNYYTKTLQNDTLEGSNLASIIEKLQNSIVGVSLVKPEGESVLDIHATQKWGMGTGIIVTRNGYILTNEHLAQTVGSRLNVTLSDGTTILGKVIWNEKNIDLAIIKIDRKNLPAVALGNSANLYVGDDVIAIGNPLGIEFQGTTTKGIVSGLNRTFMFEDNGQKVFMEDLIQTDASINPGNSGGPLMNLNGEVVGINTVKLTEAEGIGFAVPINTVKPIIEKLEKEDKFEEATLGIYAYDKEVIPYMDSKVKFEKGIYISSIDKYGPCRNTDIKEGDIIVSIDNQEISKMTELREVLYSKAPGDEVTLKVVDGEEKEVRVKLGRK